MSSTIQFDGREYAIGKAIDLSIPLRFNGAQPNAYGVPPAVSSPLRAGELVGDTRQGGSCNFEQYTFVPHCNGTHTECIGHITHQRISVSECLVDAIMGARLVSVEPENVGVDLVITGSSLASAFAGGTPELQALIIRTLPNDDNKVAAVYDGDNIPPYFTSEAMEMIVTAGYKHLLVDLPSIDRLFDDGTLLNHRMFWSVEPGSFEIHAGSRINSTISELIYVPEDVPDGYYLLNLQIAPFSADAAPSRPLLWPAVHG